MRSFLRAAFDYGTVVSLLVMCLALSLLTLSDQHPVDVSVADQVAREVNRVAPADGQVLVIVRSNDDEVDFAAEVKKRLESTGMQVEVVAGTPREARDSIDRRVAEERRLDAIVGNFYTANWSLIKNLPARDSRFASTQIIIPKSYVWPNFLKLDNLRNVTNQISVIAIVAVGMTFVIIAGGIDLSVGSLIALASIISTLIVRDVFGGFAATPTELALAAMIAILGCAIVGGISGLFIVLADIPPFIVTLAVMLAARGVALILADGNSIPELPASAVWLGRGDNLSGIPNAVVLMLITYGAAHFVLTQTVIGRYVYAVGGNRNAAWLSGVPVKRVVLLTFVLAGALAGLGGIVVTSNLQSGHPRYGEMYELYAIAAVVVGGTSLSGGRGSVLGTLVGALIIGVINNGMNLIKMNAYAQMVALGGVILMAVLMDRVKDYATDSLKNR